MYIKLIKKCVVYVDDKLEFGSISDRDKTSNAIVIHHSVGSYNKVSELHYKHKEGNGWAGIGYHFVIFKNGEIWEGRPLDKLGAHTGDSNNEVHNHKIGICVIGNFVNEKINDKQFNSLIKLILALKNESTVLYKHNDLNSTACPGEDTNIRYDEIISCTSCKKGGSFTDKESYINQFEDTNCGLYDNKIWYIPCEYSRISSPFGYRIHPIDGTRKFHYGIDMPNDAGTPIHATRSGVVSYAGYAGTAGNMVRIDHGDGYISEYMHMLDNKTNPITVKTGDKVSSNQIIGYMGSTGASTGSHLHFGIKKDNSYIDPELCLFNNPINFLEYYEIEKKLPVIPKHDPIFTSEINHTFSDNYSGMGSQHIRRGDLIGSTSVSLMCGKKLNSNICMGYSPIGLYVNDQSEKNIRQKVVAQAKTWLGTVEGTEKHKNLIDLCNNLLHWNLSYTDAWCAAYVSLIGAQLGISDIIYPSAAVDYMESHYKNKGRYYEYNPQSTLKPLSGDIAFVETMSQSIGPDHVGFINYVEDTDKGILVHTIEGNANNACCERTRYLGTGDGCVYAFARPDYGSAYHDELSLGSYLPQLEDKDTENILNLYIKDHSNATITPKKGPLNSEDSLKVATYMFNKLSRMGWNNLAIIALLANIKGESGFNPARFESDSLWNWQNGVGLVQWTPGTKLLNRIQTLKTELEDNNIPTDWYHIDAQIYLIGKYLDNYYAAYRSIYDDDIANSSTYKSDHEYHAFIDKHGLKSITMDDFKSGLSNHILSDLTRLKLLTTAFTYNYECPRGLAVDNRIKYAINLYEEISGKKIIIPKHDDRYWVNRYSKTISGVNPYPSINSTGGSTLSSNNAYVWGRSYILLKDPYMNKNDKYEDIGLCESKDQDWYEYNISNNKFDFGQIPRVNSIACWKYIGTDENKEKSYVSFVEDVIGTDLIHVSECTYCDKENSEKSEILFSTLVRNNYQNNWGLSIDDYEFQGFIYLVKLDTTLVDVNDEGVRIKTSPGKNSKCTLLFGINDIKHFNRLRIIYDLKLDLPKNIFDQEISFKDIITGNTIKGKYEKSEFDTDINSAKSKYKIYMYLTQMAISSYSSSDLWPKTYFPATPDFENITNPLFYNNYQARYPFPFGVILLNSNIPSENMLKFNERESCYEAENIVQDFNINKIDENVYFNFDLNDDKKLFIEKGNIFEGENENNKDFTLFDRLIPTYFGVSIENTISDNNFPILCASMNIKQIILYM